MRDAEVVAAIKAGGQAGLAAAYDHYAAALYTYCRSLLLDAGEAADAVQTTFLIAVAKSEQVQDSDRLQPWLLSIARNECHRRLRDQAAAAGLAEPRTAVAELAQVASEAQRSEPAELVRAAAAGLDYDERDVLDLSLDRDLDDDDLAALLGMPPAEVHKVALRARRKFEEQLSSLLIARSGRQFCSDLGFLLAGWDGDGADALRRHLAGHLERCAVCAESAVPVASRPEQPKTAVRSRRAERPTLRLITSDPPPSPAGRAAATGDSAAGTGNGEVIGPLRGTRVQLEGKAAAGGGWRSRQLGVALAGLAVLAVLATGTLLLTGLPQHRGDSGAPGTSAAGAGAAPGTTAVTPTPGQQAPPSPRGAPASPGTTHGPQTSPFHAKSSAPAPVPSTQGPGTHGPTPTSPAPTHSSAPAPLPLSAAPRAVRLCGNGSPAAPFTLTAKGGKVASFTVTMPASYAGVLTVTPGSGSLAAGQSKTIRVGVADTHRRGFTTHLTARPGPVTIRVTFQHGHGNC